MVWQQHHSVLRKSRDRRLVCIIRSCQVIRDFAFTQDKIAHIKASPITEKHQVCHLVPIWEDSLCKKGKTATECDRDKTQCKDKTPSVFPKSHVEKYPCVIERRGGGGKEVVLHSVIPKRKFTGLTEQYEGHHKKRCSDSENSSSVETGELSKALISSLGCEPQICNRVWEHGAS